MKIGILTSSRADYSIYYPLLKALRAEGSHSLEIIAFGTHLSKQHGLTVERIKEDGFDVKHTIATSPEKDTPSAITESMGQTIVRFSSLWEQTKPDLVFALGDRYEMFAACASTVSFNLQLAHIHGGEETLGAIDNVFRHSITHMASYHFTAAEKYRQRVIALKGSADHIYNVGSLSIDNLKELPLYTIPEFKERYEIDLDTPSILITFHPETVSLHRNEEFLKEIVAALDQLTGYQYIFTMPNADAMGNVVRKQINDFVQRTPHAIAVESFGTVGYLSCMKHCSMLLGNTSSGFIEASFFPKYVVNLGERQSGRILTSNIRQCSIERNEIINAVQSYRPGSEGKSVDIYGDGHASKKIVEILKTIR